MTRLIVNADDFGLSSGVNRAIVELHQAGRLTSATLMARATATEEAIEIAKATPTLGVGCHVVLVDGVAVSGDASKLSPEGRFHPALGGFLALLMTGRITEAEIEAEARAQIALLQSRGLHLTHVDTHKHTHMFPQVLRPLLRAARARGIAAVRNPFEPAWSRRATRNAPALRRAQVSLLARLAAGFKRTVAADGFVTTDGAVGVLATGTLDAAAVTALLRAAPAGTWELVTHPGYNDAELSAENTRLLASRAVERDALASVENSAAMELISFAQLLPERRIG